VREGICLTNVTLLPSLTYHTVTWHIPRGDAESRVLVVLVSVNSQLPVMNAAREADAAEDDPVVETAAGGCLVVVGEENVIVGGRRVKAEPSHCTDRS